MEDFKPGDIVKMDCGSSRFAIGEVTIVKKDTCKVLFDEDWAPSYDYYDKKDLILIERGNGK